jgi:sugar lactone lactonase YvrE
MITLKSQFKNFLICIALSAFSACGYSASKSTCLIFCSSTSSNQQTGTNTNSTIPAIPNIPNLVNGTPTTSSISNLYTIAGNQTYLDGNGINARFSHPTAVAKDSVGNLFVVDNSNSVIRKIDTSGNVTLFVGIPESAGEVDSAPGVPAQLNTPIGIAIDVNDNVYVTDQQGPTIRKISPIGVVTTFAGTANSPGTADGTGPAASFENPYGIAVDANGNVFVSDSASNIIREITPLGVVTTIAGTAGAPTAVDGNGSNAGFNTPHALALDSLGNLFVSDYGNNTIRKITPAFDVTTIAGIAGTSGSSDGLGTLATFNAPDGLAFDNSGNLFVADSGNDTIRKIDSTGNVTTVAGTASQQGASDGAGASASFIVLAGLTFDRSGNLVIVDASANLIRKMDTSSNVTTFAGALSPGNQFSPSDSTPFYSSFVSGMALDSQGNIYVSVNNLIQKITPQGVVTAFAGSSARGSADGTGIAATFFQPRGIVIDGNDTLYVADSGNHLIREITSLGVVTTLAGSTLNLTDVDGTGAAAGFKFVEELAIDASANIYVSEGNADTIRLVTQSGVVTTFAGTLSHRGHVDDTGAAARFSYPYGIVADSTGNIFVCDIGNFVIRKISPAGVVTTFAGDGNDGFLDGTGTAAEFDYPNGITIDANDNLYLTEDSGAIRKITPAGLVTTLVGTETYDSSADGPSTISQTGEPDQIAVDSNGNLVFSDDDESSIRGFTSTLIPPVVSPRTVPTPFATPTPLPPTPTPSPTPIPLVAGQFSMLTTLAGTSAFLNGVGTQARLNQPTSVAIDASGNIFFTEQGNHDIRKMDTAGNVTVFAGSAGTFGRTDGTGAAAQFYVPLGLAFDATGNLFVADSANGEIREITPAGVVTTITGTPGAYGIQDGTLAQATFNRPYGLAFDVNGNLFVSDQNAMTIRKITPGANGVVSTFVGTGNHQGHADGQGANASFRYPSDLAFDIHGNLFVADYANCLIREIDTSANVTTVAGGMNTCATSTDGNGRNATFQGPIGLVFDASGNLFISDSAGSVIRKMDTSFNVTTFAGTAGTPGSQDGTGSAASFIQPTGLNFLNGNLIVADVSSDTLRSITPGALTTTIAGIANPEALSQVDLTIHGMVMDSAGNTFYTSHSDVMKMDTHGTVTLFAGDPNGASGSQDGTGANATFSNNLLGIAIDGNDDLFVADNGNNEIRKITSTGVVTTFAGNMASNNTTDVDGTGSQAQFVGPTGIAVDSAGTIYVSETHNFTIRAITQAGVVTTLAGTSGDDGYVDDTGPNAEFESPNAMVTDSTGNLFVVDAANDVIREVTPAGVVTTFAGIAFQSGDVDGTGTQASFNNPVGITIDGSDNLYVTESNSGTSGAIRKITPGAVVTTLLADPFRSGAPSLDGDDTIGQVGTPTWIEVDYNGNLVFADANENSIRQYTSFITPAVIAPKSVPQSIPVVVIPTPTPSPTPVVYQSVSTLGGVSTYADGNGTSARLNQPTGVAYDANGNLFIVDSANHVIRKMDTSGNVTLFAGTPGVSGSADGTGSAAQFYQPFGLVFDTHGNLFVTDSLNSTIREISPVGVVTTFAGVAGATGASDGNGAAASFNHPRGITIDANNVLYVTDENNYTIRQISSNADVVTWAGVGVNGDSDGQGTAAYFGTLFGIFMNASGVLDISDYGSEALRFADGAANVTSFAGDQSNFDGVVATVADSSGNVFLANYDGSTIFEISSGGVNTLISGQDGTPGIADGNSSTALFNKPYGITLDPSGNIIVADTNNSEIRQITPAGITTTLVGAIPLVNSAMPVIDIDGNGSATLFGGVTGVVVDSTGNIFATTITNTIRKITPAGVVSTFAGVSTIGAGGYQDGTGAAALFSHPAGIAIDSSDNLYVADYGNEVIRKITPLAVVSTIAGQAGVTGEDDNSVALAATFTRPYSLAFDGNGNLFIADGTTIRELTPSGAVSTFSNATASNHGGMVLDASGNIFLCSPTHHAIFKFASDGTFIALAGKNSSWDGTDGYDYSHWTPVGITLDANGSFDIAVSQVTENAPAGGAIDRIDPTGAISTLAGVPLAQNPTQNINWPTVNNQSIDGINFINSTSTDGPLSMAHMAPTSITTDRNGNLIFGNTSDGNQTKIGSVRALLK